MRSALISLLGGLAVAVMVLAAPAKAFAADVPFFFGPVLPCTGFFQIDIPKVTTSADKKTKTVVTSSFQAVSNVATNNLPTCESLCDVFVVINNLLKLAISLLVSVFTPIMLIIGGFYVMTSGGNPGQRSKGKTIITGTLIALAIAICSALIVSQMMTLIFERSWGDTLKEKLREQATAAGVDPNDIPDFSWNTLKCQVTKGGVTVTTGGGSGTVPNPYYVPPSSTGGTTPPSTPSPTPTPTPPPGTPIQTPIR